MSKLILSLIAGTLFAVPAAAATLGPHGAECVAQARPAMLVRVEGLKSRTGIVRLQSYGGDPARFFDKGAYLERIEVRPPATGPVLVCMPVPKPGVYAVSVRHDVNGSGKSDMADGGGLSGNPNLSLMDVIFKRRPQPSRVSITVRGLTTVPIVMNYVQGTSVRPLAATGN